MKKYVTLIAIVFLMISVLAGATVKAAQPSGVRSTTKAQETPSASPSSNQTSSRSRGPYLKSER